MTFEIRKILPKPFPQPWACAWGEDEYGLWMEFSILKIRQRLRWINPGTFSMGSPEQEDGRWDNENLHDVTLTQGYWLADTACTQALWMAVMHQNPSRFTGDTALPVEQVSWIDCQKFLTTINELKAGLDLRLPTEAEWEYACRATKETSFWFGETITTDRANFNGNYPYAKGSKGEYRKKTVQVKSLPCNEWGLYQMHGNVWEWCEDWYGEYPSGTVVDPKGADHGVSRVVRGGSWYILARNVRSAYRFRSRPDFRHDFIGFRCARGQ